jgi:hypothetical protein
MDPSSFFNRIDADAMKQMPAVKALHKAIKAYKNGNHQEAQGEPHATV